MGIKGVNKSKRRACVISSIPLLPPSPPISNSTERQKQKRTHGAFLLLLSPVEPFGAARAGPRRRDPYDAAPPAARPEGGPRRLCPASPDSPAAAAPAAQGPPPIDGTHLRRCRHVSLGFISSPFLTSALLFLIVLDRAESRYLGCGEFSLLCVLGFLYDLAVHAVSLRLDIQQYRGLYDYCDMKL